MRCTRPVDVYLPNHLAILGLKKNGHYSIYKDLRPQFKRPVDADYYFRLSRIPCGQCLGCALDKREAWSVRGACELATSKVACFITLTYNDEFIPRLDDGCPTLDRKDLQDFLKRLRRRLEPIKIRYFGCGEYGSKFGRPHYHLIIYGWQPDDYYFVKLGDKILYGSTLLSELWPKGFPSVSQAEIGCIKYVAGYVAKKFGTKYPEGVQRPFVACSLKPAIGKEWFKLYGKSLITFGADGVKVQSCRIRLLDGSDHDIPATYLRWWRACYPARDFEYRLISDKKELRPLDNDVLKAREAMFDVLHKEALQKGGNHV